jgi:hypothetical protein
MLWGMDERIYAPKFRSRFWKKVAIGGPDDCWLWTGAQLGSNGRHDEQRSGYGYMWVERQKKSVYVHRVAWAYEYGDFHDVLVVCHHCDNPICCNPKHLFLGTRGANNRDRARKGRGRESRQNGEDNPCAKLTEADVRQIVARVEAGESQSIVGADFGIQQPQVSRLVHRASWAHIWTD